MQIQEQLFDAKSEHGLISTLPGQNHIDIEKHHQEKPDTAVDDFISDHQLTLNTQMEGQ